jgi:hypothetical protein
MKFMYAILAVAGWAWLVVAVLLLWWRISLLKRRGVRYGATAPTDAAAAATTASVESSAE